MNICEVQSNFQMIGSRILKVCIDNSFFHMSADSTVKKSIDVKYEIVDISKEDNTFYGTIRICIKAKVTEKPTEKGNKDLSKYRLDMTVEGCFSDSSCDNEDIFKTFLKINGCAALYSIARGFALGTSAQTLLSGQIILPMVNFIKMEEITQSQKDK